MKVKKLVSVLLALCLMLAVAVPAFAAEYNDTANNWAKSSIDRWSDYGIVTGYNGSFNPNGAMTRAAGAVVFQKLLKLTGEADLSAFTDLEDDAWYSAALSACVADGILSGVGGGKMDPSGGMDRQMFFTMFARALGIPAEDELETEFKDESNIARWAKGSIAALANRGFISGVGGDSIAPTLDINRASVMSLLDRSIVAYANEDGDTIEVPEGADDKIVLVVADDVTVKAASDVTIVVAVEDATVSLEGTTGEVEVIVREDDVSVVDAPVGTTIITADDVTGTTANGSSVAEDSSIVISDSTPVIPVDTRTEEQKVQAAVEKAVQANSTIYGTDAYGNSTGTAVASMSIDGQTITVTISDGTATVTQVYNWIAGKLVSAIDSCGVTFTTLEGDSNTLDMATSYYASGADKQQAIHDFVSGMTINSVTVTGSTKLSEIQGGSIAITAKTAANTTGYTYTFSFTAA